MAKMLEGQVAIISGGIGDIGRAIALELAGRGADIGLCGRRDESYAVEVLEEVRALGVRGRYDSVDVSDAEAVGGWIEAVEADFGLPNLIIPNAAIVQMTGLRGLTAEAWRKEMSINLDGAFYMAHIAAMKLLDKGMAGRIVFNGSWAAHAPHRHIPIYCVAKAGLRMLMKQMAMDLAEDGILVNEIAPGYVDAGLSGKAFKEKKGAAEEAMGRVPVGLLIDPAEVAMWVGHLCDPATKNVTGSVVLMDGGLSLVGPGNVKRE